MDANAASGDMVIRSQINDILELVPSVPRLHRLAGLLKGMEYDENAADVEADEEDEDEDKDERREVRGLSLFYLTILTEVLHRRNADG